MTETSGASLRFLGAANTVTGSRYLIEAGGHRALIDCGLFQGYKQLRERNRARFPVPPESIDVVVLTHAHLDHSGFVPALVRQGFRGKVICTAATRELCELLLPDSGYLQEEEAAYARRKRYSKHADPAPLYTRDDAVASLERFVTRNFDTEFDLCPGMTASFHAAGHLLGAAQIHLRVGERTVHFSGDLGRAADPLMRPPAALRAADILVCESTYGNRSHPRVDAEEELATVIRRIAERGGVLIIPAFAIGRVQGLMLHIARLKQSGKIPPVPLYLNSPMAIEATEIYHRYHAEHHVSDADCRRMYELASFVRSVAESKALNMRSGPMIIVSASGMLTGGRVLHHVAAFGPDPRNAILLSGFQAGGTRGAALVAGARTLRMFGRDVPIEAEVIAMQSLSGHADADEILTWMRSSPRAPRIAYITHGEPDAADVLRARVTRELGWPCRVPEHLEQVALTAEPPT